MLKRGKAKTFIVNRFIDRTIVQINEVLDQNLPNTLNKPITLHKAMRHLMFAGGKRLRPVLCAAAADACGGTVKIL